MPAQKRSSNHRQNNEEESSPQHRLRRKQSRGGGTDVDQQPTTSSSLTPSQSPLSQQQEQEQEQQPQHLKEEEEQQEDQPAVCDQDPVEKTQQDDSDGSGTDPEEFDEIITVLRSELRNNVQCPICLGIIKKTRTVMGCLHRFCRECIDKSMRLGNNECPACRIHCASRRSLRDDQDFDGLIEAIYPDAEKYEEEELVFCEEEKTRNEQIQASIAQISRRQSEALNKKRKMGKEADDCSLLQLPRSCFNSYSRRRKNQKIKVEESDGNEKDNDNDVNENPSPSGKPGTEIKYSTRKRQTRTQPSTTSASTSNSDGRSFVNPAAKISEDMCTQLKAARKSDTLTWGRSGARSHTCGGSRSTKSSPLSKLIDCLEGVTKAETEIDVHTMPTSLENGRNQSAEKPLLSSNPGLSVNQLLEEKPKLPKEEEEPLSAKNMKASNDFAVNSETSMDVPKSSSPNVTQPNVGLEVLDHKENLAGISCPSRNEHLAGDIHA